MRSTAAALFAALLPGLAAPAAAQAPAAPAWTEGAVCYEIFVRSFSDSDGDGVGDLEGLIGRLDYVNDGDPATPGDLGARCIWLMPVAQSPSYHGYDVTNYYQVNRDYGTNAQFRRLVEEAHRRGIRVLVDLVLNHTSAEHPYFRSALLDPASPYRSWYLWSDTARRGRDWEAPVWHRNPFRDGDFYYGLFWHGMPDLALDHPEVRAEAERIARFWLEEMGVDGFRLDAVAHFFEGADGSVRHAPANHAWLREYQAALRRIRPDVFTVGEVWDSTGALLPYYPDQLDAYFAFEVADSLLEAVRRGTPGGLLPAVLRLQRDAPRGRWATFLRNHDQTRTLTELGGDPRRARVAAAVQLTLPGIPFVYYGEELGMTGNKPDPRLRTPMHWRRAPAAGFSTGIPWEPLQPDSLTANVEALDARPGSLLNWYRRLIRLRAEHPALGRGELLPLAADHPAALAYLRRDGPRAVLVLANLGERRLDGVSLRSEGAVLPGGRLRARSLLGDGEPAPPRGAGGAVRGWVPFPALEPFEVRLVELAG